MGTPRSVRTYLIGLIAGVLLPLLLFSGFLVLRSAWHEQDVMAEAARHRTRIATAAIEEELISLRGRLFVLAGRLSLQTSDLGDFHARAREEFDGMTVVLSNAAGKEIVNTSLPYGETLPDNPDLGTLRYVAETQMPHIANLSLDPITHRPTVTINVPVTRDSRLVYVLSLDISSTLPRILGQLELPEGWIATIIDRQGILIGRSRDSARFVGQPARPEFFEHVQAADEGWVPGVSREGVPLLTAFAHTKHGGWSISSGIPRDILLAPVRETTRNLMLLGFAILALAVILAVGIGRRIAVPVIGLVPAAEAVGHGERSLLQLTPLTEANVVARSLFDAGERLQRTAAEREAAIEALGRSEQMYRALAEDLAKVDEERTALLSRMVLAQENERKRIARELHDSLAQYLTALRLKLNSMTQLSDNARLRPEAVDELSALIGELGTAVNRMAWELRPVALDELGLRSAVDHYLEEWAELANLQVDTEIDLNGHELPQAVEATLFRVLQEATTNVLRHADASRVGVILEATADSVRLIVEDDGKGFVADSSRLPFAAARQFGLLGMRERLALVHGDLDVESTPDQGTTLFIKIPIRRRHRLP